MLYEVITITHISGYIRDLVDYIVSGVNVENIIVDYDLDDRNNFV